MKLASFFFLSLAVHGMVLTLPLADFDAGDEHAISVTLLLKDDGETTPKPRAQAAPAKPVRAPDRRRWTKPAPQPAKIEAPAAAESTVPVEPLRRVQEARRTAGRGTWTAERTDIPATQISPSPSQAHAGPPPDLPETRESFDVAAGEETEPADAVRFTAARYAHNPKPDYPDQAKRQGWEGSVLLRVLVGPQGAPENIEVNLSSGFAILDQAARDTVARWRFHPAHVDDRAVPSWVKIPIVFRLAEANS